MDSKELEYWKRCLLRTVENIQRNIWTGITRRDKWTSFPYPFSLRIPRAAYEDLTIEQKEFVDKIVRECESNTTEVKYI